MDAASPAAAHDGASEQSAGCTYPGSVQTAPAVAQPETVPVPDQHLVPGSEQPQSAAQADTGEDAGNGPPVVPASSLGAQLAVCIATAEQLADASQPPPPPLLPEQHRVGSCIIASTGYLPPAATRILRLVVVAIRALRHAAKTPEEAAACEAAAADDRLTAAMAVQLAELPGDVAVSCLLRLCRCDTRAVNAFTPDAVGDFVVSSACRVFPAPTKMGTSLAIFDR